jgi:Tol biopolymer transport system component
MHDMKPLKTLSFLMLGMLMMGFLSTAAKAQKGKPQPPPPQPSCGSYQPAVAYVRKVVANRTNQQFELMVMNADGTCAKTVYVNKQLINPPTWSPDGKYLAFDAETADPNDLDERDLYVVELPKTFDAAPSLPCVVRTPELSNTGRDWPYSPAWSPVPLGNGRYKLAYSTNVTVPITLPDGSSSNVDTFALFMADVDGQCTSGSDPVVVTSPSPDFRVDLPKWSRDGKYLAAVVNTNPGGTTPEGFDLYVFPVLETSGSVSLGTGVNVTPPAGSRSYTGELAVFSADWGKQSNRIVFQARIWDAELQQNVGGGLYIIDLGANVPLALLAPPPPSVLTYLPNFEEYNPNWSPDDSLVVFQAQELVRNKLSKPALYTVFASGSNANNPTLLAAPGDTESGYYFPVWRR